MTTVKREQEDIIIPLYACGGMILGVVAVGVLIVQSGYWGNSNINLTAALEKEGWTMECVAWDNSTCHEECHHYAWGHCDTGAIEMTKSCYEVCDENPCTAYTWRKEATG